MKLYININGPKKPYGYSDTDYAGDNNTQKIVTGYRFLINKAVIAWNFRSQKTVTKYVTEDKYSEITEVC